MARRDAGRTCRSLGEVGDGLPDGSGRLAANLGEVRPRGTKRLMREGRKSRIETEAAHCDDTLAVLGHTEVRGIHLSEMDPVSSRNSRCQEVTQILAIPGRQESFHILEYEGLGLAFRNDRGKVPHE